MGPLPVNPPVDGQPRVFVTDYDGTLLTDHRTLLPRDLETLSRLRADGVVTVIATGRSLFSFERSLDTMGLSAGALNVDYLIFSTGAGIMDLRTGRLIRSLDLDQVHIGAACRYFDRKGVDYMVHKPIPDTPYFLYKSNGRPNPDFDARLALYPGLGRPLESGNGLFAKATEVLAILPEGDMVMTREEVQDALEGTSVILATSPIDRRSLWIEVFHRNVSKSQAMAWLATRLGTGPGAVTSVGNDFNDLDLLEWSGTACLVENAPEAMGKGWVRVRSNNCNGVTHAAETVGLLD